ncbi:hypothetical protein CBW16_08020 [Flavobacteriaceae bacterium JJC]|uniref:hypothetical protein n=1 Tax=Kaistella soli TaxID=2849654 RepID=UPI000B4C1DEC|nr:hypothetical protein [Kaistella soli]MBU8882672.1 hypothetical protein [Kaistella soli]OWK73456.1 hypothetical protein CBW16_08020 [Flavobacteriaceae bacterium JJC]
MKKIVLSAAFAIMGTFAMAQQTPMMQHKDPAQMEQKRAEKLKMMKTELNLTDAQVAKIKALQDKKMEEMKQNAPQRQAERKAKMEAMKAKREQWKAEMKEILTPAQYAKWEAKQKEKMQDKRQNMQHRQMKKMPAKASS